MENYINEMTKKKMELFEQLSMLKDTTALKRIKDLIEGSSAIDSYIVHSDCLSEDEIAALKLGLSKLLKYASIEAGHIRKKQSDNGIFSIKEWESYTEDRKLSIYMFATFAFKANGIDGNEYERIFNQFDSKTLKWLRDNTPHEDVRDLIEHFYLNSEDDE